MIWLRLLPWAGWPLLAVMTWLYLGQRDETAKQVELCNAQKLTAIVQAERIARERLSEAHRRELEQRDAIIRAERSALAAARSDAERAHISASEASATIERLKQAAEDSDDATIEQVCLLTPVPVDLVDSLRQ